MATDERLAAVQDLAQRALQVQARLARQNVPFGVVVQPDEEGNPNTLTILSGFVTVALCEMLATALERGEIRLYHGDPPRFVGPGGPQPGAAPVAPPGSLAGSEPDRKPQITMEPVDDEEGE